MLCACLQNSACACKHECELCAGSMQLRKLRQLCGRLFKLPASPPILCVRDLSGTLVPCCAAEDATLRELDFKVRTRCLQA